MAIRNQLKVDLKANLNKDLAEQIEKLIDDHVALVAAHNALLAQLDLDAGVTDTDYEANHEVTATLDVD